MYEGFLGTHLCVFGLSPRNGGIFLLRARDVSRLFTGPCSHCRSQQTATCDVRGRQLALNHLTHMHGTRHATAPRSDCELLSLRRSVRSPSRSAVTTSCSSCSSTTSTPSSNCITLGTSGRCASLEEQDVPVDLVYSIASFALHRASGWLVEPCRCLGPLSRTVQHPASTGSETEK